MADQNNPNQPNQTTSQPSERAVKDQIALLSFVDEIIKERQDSSITPDNLPKIKELLLKEVNDSINRHLISLLTDKDQLELDEMLEKNITDEQIDDFFAKKIPNLQAEIASVLLNFRAAYLYPVRDRIKKEAEEKIKLLTTDQPTQKTDKPSGFPPPAPIPSDKVN